MKDKLNILIANDDGIDSPGIVRLAEAAAKFGSVWVAAPSSQCSGMSQKLTIFGEFLVSRPAFPVDVMDAWSIGGTPADCVKLAVNFLMPVKPDVVFSGINFGYNTGFDIAYSGTVGAAMEALINGIPAIAFSSQHDGSSDVTDKYLVPVIEELLSSPIGRGEIWNVNFPAARLRTAAAFCVSASPHRCASLITTMIRPSSPTAPSSSAPMPSSSAPTARPRAATSMPFLTATSP